MFRNYDTDYKNSHRGFGNYSQFCDTCKPLGSSHYVLYLVGNMFPQENTSENKHPDSFQSSMIPLLILGQVCGLVPVQGISGPSLRFSWANGVHGYAFIIFAVTLFFDCCYTVDNFKSEIRIDVFASTVFYTVCLLTTIFFIEIAKQLPRISQSFSQIEADMQDYGHPPRLGFRIKAFLFSFIFLAIIEHGTLVFINLKNAWINSRDGREGFGYLFYASHFPAINRRLSYSGLGTLLLFWVNAMCTFNWNYLDFFIIVVSMETYSRFGLINSRLASKNLSKESRTFWEEITRNYNQISLLVKDLDQKLSKVILTSFFSNMYHLSLQLVRSLKSLYYTLYYQVWSNRRRWRVRKRSLTSSSFSRISGTIFQMTYFYFSLSYLIIRLLLVLYFAAKINDESKKPWGFVSPLENPCHEAVRFMHQVHTDEVALTGNRFFTMNQKFVVSIVGTIVTYQGVLLQFNSLKGDVY